MRPPKACAMASADHVLPEPDGPASAIRAFSASLTASTNTYSAIAVLPRAGGLVEGGQDRLVLGAVPGPDPLPAPVHRRADVREQQLHAAAVLVLAVAEQLGLGRD